MVSQAFWAALPWVGLVSAGAFFAAQQRLRRVGEALPFDLPRLEASLKRQGAECLCRWRDRSDEAGFAGQPMHELLVALCWAEGPHLPFCEEALSDVEARLDWGSDIAKGATRLCIYGTTLALVLMVLAQRKLTPELLPLIAVGGAGALLVRSASKAAETLAKLKKEQLDSLIDASLAVLPPPIEAPARQRGARNRRR